MFSSEILVIVISILIFIILVCGTIIFILKYKSRITLKALIIIIIGSLASLINIYGILFLFQPLVTLSLLDFSHTTLQISMLSLYFINLFGITPLYGLSMYTFFPRQFIKQCLIILCSIIFIIACAELIMTILYRTLTYSQFTTDVLPFSFYCSFLLPVILKTLSLTISSIYSYYAWNECIPNTQAKNITIYKICIGFCYLSYIFPYCGISYNALTFWIIFISRIITSLLHLSYLYLYAFYGHDWLSIYVIHTLPYINSWCKETANDIFTNHVDICTHTQDTIDAHDASNTPQTQQQKFMNIINTTFMLDSVHTCDVALEPKTFDTVYNPYDKPRKYPVLLNLVKKCIKKNDYETDVFLLQCCKEWTTKKIPTAYFLAMCRYIINTWTPPRCAMNFENTEISFKDYLGFVDLSSEMDILYITSWIDTISLTLFCICKDTVSQKNMYTSMLYKTRKKSKKETKQLLKHQ